jgi:vacuolar protein sorting-associated protein 54
MLRTSLQNQASKYVSRFHEERKTKLSLILDNERWKQADVPLEFQELVDHISATGQLSLPVKKSESEKQPSEFLVVDGQQYAVVGTMLMLLKIIIEYCQIITDIPSTTPEVLNRLVELLKMFNSRTCQLILGAGALHLVGLKNINTKNLGLASRCLQLVVHFLPLLRQHFEERLNGKQLNMLKHFDHLLKDYTDHITEISNKLVAIMDSMIEMSLAKWEVKAPMPSACFRGIVRQITKLHEAVFGLLPPLQIRELFLRLHNSFKRTLRLQLKKLGVTRDGGPQHGLVMSDVAFYATSLRSLPGLSDLDVNVDDIWDKK